MFALPLQQGVCVLKHVHHDPFGDLQAIDARGGSQRDAGVTIERCVRDMINAGRDVVDKLQVGACAGVGTAERVTRSVVL